jgi:hypothetical protein
MISGHKISKVGTGVNDFWMAEVSHIDPQTGLEMIYVRDQDYYNETGETRRMKDADGNDMTVRATTTTWDNNRFHFKNKNQIPKYFGGITNNFAYKNLDLGFQFTFSGGNYFMDQAMQDATQRVAEYPWLEFYENRWKKPGDIAKYPRPFWNNNVLMEDGSLLGIGDFRQRALSSYMYKADYLRFKNITLGYTLNKLKFAKDIRIYVSAENICTWFLDDYEGYDVETNTSPTGAGWNIPLLFSATAGVSIKF